MGASAEGKISLSVELANFKDLASNLKKGLSAELKQVPLDIEFNNKELEKRTAEAVSKINEMLKASRIKGLDLSSILPNFVNALNAEGIGEDARARVAEGFATGLGNFKEVIDKTNYSKFKNLGGEDLKRVFTDLNTVMDIINSMKGLSKRQRKAMIDTFTPSMSDLDTRGGEAAWKKYTKGAKKLDAVLQLKDEYSDVLQYGTSKSATREAIGDLSVKLNSSDFSKKDAKDLIGYITRYQFIGGENAHDFDKLLESDVMITFIKEKFKEGFVDTLKARSNSYFEALDKIFNSTAREIDYSDLLRGVDNTTNKKLEGMYNSKASEELEKIEVGKEIRSRVKIKSDEKPELRKREKKEDVKDTTRTKTGLTKEDEEEFKFDDEERSIAEIEKDLQDIESRLSQVRDKLTKTSDERTQLENEIANQEKIFEEKDTVYTTFKSKYEQYSSFAKNAKYEADALKGTVANLDEQLEEEKQNKEKIESRYNQLIKKREEIKKEIEEKEKQLEAILPKIQEQETGFEKQLADLDNKKKEAQKVVKDKEAYNKEVLPIQDKWLEWYDEALQKEYKFEGTKAKSEAFDALKRLGNKYVEFRRNPNLSTAEDKEAESARFAVKHYKLWQAAKEAGVAESRLDREKFDTDDDLAYQQAVEYLQKQRENTEQRRENLKAELEKAKAEVTKIQEDISKVKEQQEDLQKEKSKLLREFRAKPANKEDDNEAKIRREQSQLESSNTKIQKLETLKSEPEKKLKELEEYLQKNELTEERKTKYDNRLEELKKERDTQEKILKQKKDSLQTTISEQNQLIQLEQELQENQNALIQEQKESKARQEELDRQEEERRKKTEEERKKQEEANRKKQENKTKTDFETKATTEETQGSGTTNMGTGTGTSIPPEKLKEILTLLGNIQKALGTLEDGSDIPSITQSVKNMADALKELSSALSEIKQKDFNLNIGLPSNNPIGQQGEAKRKILKELAQQYDELNSYFVNKYGDDSSAFNALSKLNGGSNYVNTMMSDYSIIGDTSASLSDKIEVYKTLVEQLRSFLIQEGGDINNVLTNVLSPEEIINKITDDIAKFNPTTALQNIFEKMKISIDASLAQINTESKGFSFLSGSAEEAAEAKRKFVEANKEVLQSIVASMPKIEEEAKALEKVEEIKEKNNKTSEDFIEDKANIEKQKKQAEEIVKKQKEVQEQYENQFHAWGEDGQLSFLDKNDYDLQNEYLELQKQEAEQLAKQAEQNPLKINIPIEGQISFTNEEDISKIANEVYENSFVENKDGQYSLFRNVEMASDWGQELKEDLQEASKTDFSNIKHQLSLKDWEATIDKRNKGIEEQFKKIYNSKSFIQDTDLSDEFLKTYKNISTKNGEGYKATSNLRELKNFSDELKDIKTKLKISFDEVGNLKSTSDPLQAQDLLNRYDELVSKIQRLKLLISSPSSQESFLLKEFEQLAKAEEEAANKAEILKKKTQEALNKTLSDKKFLSGKDIDITALDDYFKIGSSENLDRVRSTVEEIKILKEQLRSSKNADGSMIENPEQVQGLIDKYNNLINVLESLIIKIKLPDSVETIGLKIAQDADKAKEELDELKTKVNEFFEYKKADLVDTVGQGIIKKYGTTDADNNLVPIDSLMFESNEELIKQQGYVIALSKALDEYKIAVENLKKLQESDTTNLEDLKEANKQVESLQTKIAKIEEIIKKSNNINATDKQIGGLTTKIESILGKNNNLPEDVSSRLKSYLDLLKSGASISKNAYDSMSADVSQFATVQKKSFSIWDMMTMKIKEGVAFLATKFSFYQVFNQFRQGFQVIHQFDDALTEMMKVSDETRKSLEAYQKTTFDTAEAIGSNALQIQNSTADFMRLGESLKEASESAKTANILMNVSEFQSIDEATKSLIAMSAAYDDLSKAQIIDKLNEVGNNYSISTSGAAEALQASASALKTAGNDMDEALALVTAGNQIVQDVAKAGNGLRTIALRLTGKQMCPNIE